MLTYFICQKMLMFDDCCIRTFVLDVASAWLDTLLDVIDLLPKEVIKKEVSSSPYPQDRSPQTPPTIKSVNIPHLMSKLDKQQEWLSLFSAKLNKKLSLIGSIKSS